MRKHCAKEDCPERYYFQEKCQDLSNVLPNVGGFLAEKPFESSYLYQKCAFCTYRHPLDNKATGQCLTKHMLPEFVVEKAKRQQSAVVNMILNTPMQKVCSNYRRGPIFPTTEEAKQACTTNPSCVYDEHGCRVKKCYHHTDQQACDASLCEWNKYEEKCSELVCEKYDDLHECGKDPKCIVNEAPGTSRNDYFTKHWSEVHNMFFYKHAETGLPVETIPEPTSLLVTSPVTTLLEKDPEKLQEYVKNVFEEVDRDHFFVSKADVFCRLKQCDDVPISNCMDYMMERVKLRTKDGAFYECTMDSDTLQKCIPKTCKNFKELTIAYSEIPCEDVHGKGIVATPCKQTGTDDGTFCAPKTCVDNATKAECDRANKRKDLLTGTWEPLQLQKCVWEGSTCRPFQCSQYSNIYKKAEDAELMCNDDVRCVYNNATCRDKRCEALPASGQDSDRQICLEHGCRWDKTQDGYDCRTPQEVTLTLKGRKGNLRSDLFGVERLDASSDEMTIGIHTFSLELIQGDPENLLNRSNIPDDGEDFSDRNGTVQISCDQD